MKIQSLAVMFIILILPISLVLSSYTQSRIETLSLQSSYDSKLNDATYDALKAYQLNSLSSDTSDYTNSKMRDIEASVNTFFNSLSTNFASLGYTKTTIQNYVPAVVYTMYDGYYIYAPYTNTWYTDNANQEIKDEIDSQTSGQTSYSNGEKLYGLKPYVYYSCRYKKYDTDVIITYSLDNYIQIQGKVNNKPVSKYGYLLTNTDETGNTYKGVKINENETLKENIYVEGKKGEYSYIKEKGTKYYLDTDGITVFTVLKGKKIIQKGYDTNKITNNNSAKQYYKEASELKKFIETSDLKDLTTSDIVNIETGSKYAEGESPYYSISGKIFDFSNSDGIESEESNFNTHRIDVIKNAITRNLSVAIANYNRYSNVTTDFQMPKLKDTDWDKIIDNISIISFLQGMNIGGKVYNGYSIITNTKNEDVVTEDSIYIRTVGDTFCRVTENGLKDDDIEIGIFNVNLERRSGEDSNGNTVYYFPVAGTLSYGSIITQNNIGIKNDETLTSYLKKQSNKLQTIYYTALGRERYSLYRQQLIIEYN